MNTCENYTNVDRFNNPLNCLEGESIVSDVLIQQNLKCPPFMSFRCDKCGCKNPKRTMPPSGCKKNNYYIESWLVTTDCVFAVGACGTGIDALPPDGYNIPSCRVGGKFISWSKSLNISKIAFDFNKVVSTFGLA